jgi:hypothetical protein
MRKIHYVVLALVSAWAVGWLATGLYEYAASLKGGEDQLGLAFAVLAGVTPLALYLVIALVVWLVIRTGRRG